MADIEFDRKDGVATVTLNRPEARNAITPAMVGEFTAFLLSVEKDPTIRCVLLQGAGEHFMAGGDVKSFSETLTLTGEQRRHQFEGRVQAVAPLMQVMQRMPQILISAVRGACAGAGLGWVAGSDLAIATRSSFFLLAQINLGLPPDGSSTYWLPRCVSLKRAKEIALLGGRFTAEEAESWGLLNRVVDDADFDVEVSKLVSRVANGPAAALGHTKRLLNQSLDNTLATQLQAEAEAFSSCAAEADFAEGARAFVEKRRPRFGQ